MHEAYEVSHLLSLQLQIETIAAYENIVLIGTRQGQVLMYLCKSTDNGNGRVEVKLDLQRKQELCKKPIQQIDVIPEDKLLLCLSDNLLSRYTISENGFAFQQSFQDTKGASLFALDIKNIKTTEAMTGGINCVVRLCVAVKRKLQLYIGKKGEFKQHMFDFNINDVPKVMVWGTEYLWVGFKSDYTLFDLSSNKPKELFPVSSSSSRSAEPIVAKYSDTCFILGRDNTSVLVPEAKDIQTQQTIKWTEPTVALVWDEPYLIGLMQDKAAVQTVDPNHFIQTLSELNKARLMYKCSKGIIYVASIGQLWLIKSVDISKQRQELEKNKQFQLAIQLTELSDCPEEEKKEQIKKINKQYAYDLFNQGDYLAAMQEYIKLSIDPAEVISLFPELDLTNNGEASRLKGKDLEKALEALIEYLTALRAKVCKENKDSKAGDGSQRNVAQLLELIDTTLLKCYLQTNDALIAPLLRLNNCRLEEAERTLLQHGKHSELIILYQTKKQHTKALQLLREQAKQPDSSLHGYRSTKKYLQQLGSEHLHIIFNFSDWILKEHPEEGLQIFTEDKIEVENLPRIKILDFLLKQHEQLVIPYLEHVIHTWNETDSQFHDVLINKYREKITDKKANITEEELQHTKSKLIKFLEQSCYYTPERMILYFPSDSLFEERAILLGRLGRHEQALTIYVQVLGNVEKAIKYCDNVTKQQSDKAQDVYVALMRILVNPEQTSTLTGPLANVPRHPKSSVPDLETALDILEKYADKISPLKALAVLPDSVPLMRLKTFLISSLDNQLTLKRRMQVLKGLLYAEHLQVQELKQFHESKSVIINDYNVCPVCKKRFGNQSAFVRYPNGDIVHYSCRIDK